MSQDTDKLQPGDVEVGALGHAHLSSPEGSPSANEQSANQPGTQPMTVWKKLISFLTYKLLRNLLKVSGLSKLRVVRRAKHLAHERITRMIFHEDQVLVEVEGYKMYMWNDTASSVQARNYEPYTTELFKQALAAGATVVNIGAHVGYYTLLAARLVGERGRVYAFEPEPANFHLLVRNIELNGFKNVIAVDKAVMHQTGTFDLCLSEGSGCHSIALASAAADKAVRRIPVECVALDDFLRAQRVGTVDVVLMDTEGSDFFVLEGMEELIRKSNNFVLFCELSPMGLRRAGVKPEALLQKLASFGFEVELIGEPVRHLRPATRADIDRLEASESVANLRCIKRNRLAYA